MMKESTRNLNHPHGRRQTLVLILSLIILAALALSACGSEASQAELPDDGPPPVTSQEAAQRFVEKVVAAGESSKAGGQFTLTVTEEEVNSFLTIGATLLEQLQTVPLEDIDPTDALPGLGEIEERSEWEALLKQMEKLPDVQLPNVGTGLTIEEPQVHFRGDGRVIVHGYGKILRWRQPVRAVVTAHAADGELEIDFVEGQLGNVSMPEFIFDIIGKSVTEALVLGQDYAEITEIRVSEGTLTLTGRRKP